MIVYQNSKSGFLDDAFKKDIEDVILAEFTERTGRRVAAAEVRAWKESLLSVAKVLNDDEIPADSGVAIEYNIPQTGKRIDFMLSGNSELHGDCLVILHDLLRRSEGLCEGQRHRPDGRCGGARFDPHADR